MDQQSQNYWQPGDQQNQPQQIETPPGQATPPSPGLKDEPEIAWQASEYIHHEKGMVWYVVLGLVTLIGAAVAALFQQWILAVLVVVMGVAIGVYARRPPHEITYRISEPGVYIDNRLLPYETFRSFGVIDDGAFYALQLRPSKRFMPAVTIYFAEDDGERIVDALSEHLPIEDIRPDMVDNLMRWLRF